MVPSVLAVDFAAGSISEPDPPPLGGGVEHRGGSRCRSMSADSCALRLGISVRAYERVLRFKGHSRFALLSLLSWLLLMAQTTSMATRKCLRGTEAWDLDRAVGYQSA